jgi:hypothetical protein
MKNNNKQNHSPSVTVVVSPSPTAPVGGKFYYNSDTCKAKILASENKNKSGIYM